MSGSNQSFSWDWLAMEILIDVATTFWSVRNCEHLTLVICYQQAIDLVETFRGIVL